MTRTVKCKACRDGEEFGPPIAMAFQPIVDVAEGRVLAHEALVRGADGSSACSVLEQVTSSNRYAFDQQCRVSAIEARANLHAEGKTSILSINFLPNAVYEPRACIRLTLETAERTGLPIDQIMFEFVETEALDTDHLLKVLQAYRSLGFKTAIDDFGRGYSGLELLCKFQPDFVKVDMALIRDIDTSDVKRSIVKHQHQMLEDLGIQMICEGVETRAEFDVLQNLGINLMQGYLFAKPEIEALPEPIWPH